MLYDEDGVRIGRLSWNARGIQLEGCIKCQTPAKLREARLNGGVLVPWTFSMFEGTVQIRMGNEVMYENELKGECLERYSAVLRFSFYNTDCQSSFSFMSDVMEAGSQISQDCHSVCSGR